VLHQRRKDLIFLLLQKATLPNYWLKRSQAALFPRAENTRHLHLGCGTKYLSGFINVDANPRTKVDLWLDIRCGLPFASRSVDSIYTAHMLEHLYPYELTRLLRDCFRVLKPGSGLRAVVPNLASAVLAYQERRPEWFHNWPVEHQSWGGKFSNYIFCSGQHRTAFDFEYLSEVLYNAGFRDVQQSSEGHSNIYGELVPSFEPREDLPHSLFVEAFA